MCKTYECQDLYEAFLGLDRYYNAWLIERLFVKLGKMFMVAKVKNLSRRGRAFVAGGFLTALVVTTLAPALGGAGVALLVSETAITLAGGIFAASQA
jgi:hypothetical protein